MKIRRLNRTVKAATPKAAPASRYQSDDEFREKHKAQARDTYRKSAGNFERASPARSLDYFARLAQQLAVEYNGRTITVSCIKVTALADLLQISYQSLWRSLNVGSIPAPILITRMGKRELLVYSQDEVRVILTIIAEHKRQFSYYRKDHHHTRQRLFDDITAIRNEWETTWPAHPVARSPRKPPPQPQQSPKRLSLPLKRKKP